MRPVSDQRNVVQYPLDSILGSEAHVRLLRVFLNEVDTSLGASDAARLAGLTPQWARKALDRLARSGLVLRTGGGRAPQFGLSEGHLLLEPLRLLYRREQERYNALLAALRSALTDMREIHQAWVEKLPKREDEAVEITVVSEVKAMGWIGEEVRSRLIGSERHFDVIIEVATVARADAPEPGPNAVFLVSLGGTSKSRARRSTQTHQQAEERSLLFAKGIAQLIRSDPSLIKRAKHHLNRLTREDHGPATGDIAEWKQLLDTYSPERIRQLLVSRSSRADRLRQSSPFFAVLSGKERDLLLGFQGDRR